MANLSPVLSSNPLGTLKNEHLALKNGRPIISPHSPVNNTLDIWTLLLL